MQPARERQLFLNFSSLNMDFFSNSQWTAKTLYSVSGDPLSLSLVNLPNSNPSTASFLSGHCASIIMKPLLVVCCYCYVDSQTPPVISSFCPMIKRLSDRCLGLYVLIKPGQATQILSSWKKFGGEARCTAICESVPTAAHHMTKLPHTFQLFEIGTRDTY